MADQLVAGDSYVANNSIHDTMQVISWSLTMNKT